MKSITTFLNESIYDSITTLHFASTAAAVLYKCEFEGQISDGKYENARPFDHWKWVTKTQSVCDGTEGYEGIKHRRSYNFKDYMRNALKIFHGQKVENYEWTIRDIYYICLGKLINKNDINKIEDEYADTVAKLFGQNIDKNFDDIEVPKYASNINSSKYFTKSYFDKFKSEYENISDSEIKQIFASAQKTINTKL